VDSYFSTSIFFGAKYDHWLNDLSFEISCKPQHHCISIMAAHGNLHPHRDIDYNIEIAATTAMDRCEQAAQ
jgi:hypothetical protein